MSFLKNRWTLLGIVVVVGVFLDQITKQWAHANLRGQPFQIIVDGFFQLRYSRNPGAFFSLGADLSPGVRRTFFVVATVIAIGLISQLYRKAQEDQRALRWALMLLLAGAFGNLIDRVLYGEVIDFLHLHVKDVFHWATFNFADIYITFGLVFLLLDAFKGKRPAEQGSAGTATPGSSGS